MAEANIAEFYKKAEVIPKLKELVEYSYKQDGFYVNRIWKEIAPTLAEMCHEYALMLDQKPEDSELYKDIMAVVDAGPDLCLTGIVVRDGIIPKLEKYFEAYYVEEETESKRYVVKSSKSGFLTVFDNVRGVYLNSPDDPVTEAKKLAESVYKPDFQRMVLLGAGMGYLAYELFKLSEGTLDIVLYEDDAEILSLALAYGMLGYIPEEHLFVLSGETEEETVTSYLEDRGDEKHKSGRYAFWWYVIDGDNKKRQDLSRENLQVSVANRDNLKLEINYWRNLQNIEGLATEIPKQYKLHDEWVVVAGGPSVDENLDFIRESMGKRTILTASTSLGKLNNEGITPDFVVASDPGINTFKYFENVLELESPLIIAPTLYWKCAEKYSGKKYMAPIIANTAMGIRLYKSGIREWKSGYTITVLAMESAIKLGAKKIFIIGADFAYPGGFTHASGTAFRKKVDVDTFGVESADGGVVQTSEDLNMFRLELEKLLSNYDNVKIVNMSKHGAKIKGTCSYND